jgi:hypothetical protein
MITLSKLTTYAENHNLTLEITGPHSYLKSYSDQIGGEFVDWGRFDKFQVGFEFKPNVYYWWSTIAFIDTLEELNSGPYQLIFEQRYNRANGVKISGWRTGYTAEDKINEYIDNLKLAEMESAKTQSPVNVTEKELAVIRAFGTTEYEGLDFFGTWMWSIQEHSELSKSSFSGVCSSLHEKGLATSDTTGDPHMGMKIQDTWSMALTEKGAQVYFDHFGEELAEYWGMSLEEIRTHLSETFRTEIINNFKKSINPKFNILTNKNMKNSENIKTNLSTFTVSVLKEKATELGIEFKSRENKASLVEKIVNHLSEEAARQEQIQVFKDSSKANQAKKAKATPSDKIKADEKASHVEKSNKKTKKAPAKAKAPSEAETEAAKEIARLKKEAKEAKAEAAAAKIEAKVAKKEAEPKAAPSKEAPKSTKEKFYQVSARSKGKKLSRPVGVAKATCVAKACVQFSQGSDGVFYSAKAITEEEYNAEIAKAEKKGKKAKAPKANKKAKAPKAKLERAPMYLRISAVGEVVVDFKSEFKSVEELVTLSDARYIDKTGKASNLKEQKTQTQKALALLAAMGQAVTFKS